MLGRDAARAADIDALATQLIALVDREVDLALLLGMRQDDRRFALYGITHAMHTTTVALLSARTLGWAEAAQRRMVLAALTMNAAIVELQGRMAEQADPPTKKQMETIRAHPRASVTALLDARGKALPGAPRRDTAQADFAIAAPLLDRSGVPRVLPEQGYGLIEP